MENLVYSSLHLLPFFLLLNILSKVLRPEFNGGLKKKSANIKPEGKWGFYLARLTAPWLINALLFAYYILQRPHYHQRDLQIPLNQLP